LFVYDRKMEKVYIIGQVVGVLFIDFRKAFDTPKSSEENECLWYVSGDIYSYLKN